LDISESLGAKIIIRPPELSNDHATSESGWLHAINEIEKNFYKVDWVIAPQVTSPLRKPEDIKNLIKLVDSNKYDSFFSACKLSDFFIWQMKNNTPKSMNFDWKNRKRRQDIEFQYVENGSLYAFRKSLIEKSHNRLGGKIGILPMEFWQMFEIDNKEDFRLCEAIMKEFIIGTMSNQK